MQINIIMLKIIILILLLLILLSFIYKIPVLEKYNDEVGTFCNKCSSNNTINKCLICYNCNWIPSIGCVPGSYKGPYNKSLQNNIWYSGDPITFPQ